MHGKMGGIHILDLRGAAFDKTEHEIGEELLAVLSGIPLNQVLHIVMNSQTSPIVVSQVDIFAAKVLVVDYICYGDFESLEKLSADTDFKDRIKFVMDEPAERIMAARVWMMDE